MKNNYQCNFNGVRMGGGSIEHPLSIHSASIGTRWKPRGMQLICTLVLLFTFAIGNVWAADPEERVGTYSTQVISADGTTSTWTFILPSSQVTVPTGETTDNDIIYAPSGSSKMKFSSSNGLSWSAVSSGYIYVPAGSAGTISMTLKSNSDSRYLQLYVNGSAAANSKRLWSKYAAEPTSDGKKGPQSFAFTASDLTTKGGKTYLHFKDNDTEMKIATFSVTLTTGSYASTVAPAITAPTTDRSATYTVGDEIEALSVTATGKPAPTYQWYSNTSASTEGATTLTGATNASYTPSNAAASDLYYYCIATNSKGSAQSPYFHVTVNAPSAPTHNITYTNTKDATNTNPDTYYEGVGIASFAPLADVADFHFTGWYPATISDTEDQNVEVEAQWVDAYNVSFSAGAGSGTAPDGFQKWEGAKFNLPGQGEMVAPANTVFDGWKASGTKYAENAEYTMGDAEVAFVAQWKAVPVVLFHYQQSNLSGNLAAGTYDAIGGTLTTSAAMSKESAAYNAAVPNDLKGGANVSKLGSNAAYIQLTLTTGKFKEGDTVYICGYNPYKISSTTELTADIAASFTTGTAKGDYNIGYAIIPEGIEQSSIYLSRAEGNGTGFAAVKVIRPAAKEVVSTVNTLTDVKVNGTSISDANLASLVSEQSLALSDELVSAPTITFNKHTVITYDDNSNKVTDTPIEVTATDNGAGKWSASTTIDAVTYTVTLVKLESYEVSFDKNGGDGNMNAVSYAAGAAVTLPACTFTAPNGKEFDKWISDDVTITSGTFNMPASDVTVKASWKDITYAVTYHANGATGTVPAVADYAANAVVIVAGKGDLARTIGTEAATFYGWNTKADMSGTRYEAGAEFNMPAADVDLYAVWGFAINYNLDGGTINDATYATWYVSTGTTTSISTPLPSNVTREGYTFDGWYTQNGAGNKVTSINAEYTGDFAGDWKLKAKWILSAPIGKAQSIDMEGLVESDGTSAEWQNYLYSHGYSFSTENVSLDEKKDPSEDKAYDNWPYQGLKIKKTGSYVQGTVDAGKLVIIKLGHMAAAATVTIGGVAQANATGLDAAEPAGKYNYYYVASESVLRYETNSNDACVLKAITITDPYQVTFNANGGDPVAAQYGHPSVTLPSATNGSQIFLGWFTEETDGTKIGEANESYTPSADITLYAHWEAVSSDARLASISFSSAAGTLSPAFDPEVVNYTYTMPYGTAAIPTITGATSVNANAQAPIIGDAAAAWGEAQTIKGVAESDDKKTYTITMLQAPKDGVAIISIDVPTGNGNVQTIAADNISGFIGGTATQKLQNGSKKLGSNGNYIGFTLANSEELQAGDVIRLNVSATNGASHLTLYQDGSDANLVKDIEWTATEGINLIPIPSEAVGLSTLYIYRKSNVCNPTLSEFAILRPMDPVMTAITINGRDGQIDPLDDKHFNVTIPFESELDNLTVVPEVVWNAAHATTPTAVVSNGGEWVLTAAGDNTYRIMDKDGDYTDYTITLIRDIQKYTVTFNAQGGSTVQSELVVAGEKLAAAPADPTREDYLFLGWAETAEGEVVDVTDFVINADKEFYAQWQDENPIKLIIDGTGNTKVLNSEKFYTGATLASGTVNVDEVPYKYATLSNTATTPVQNDKTKLIAYNATTTKTKLMVDVYNSSTSDRQVNIFAAREGSGEYETLATLALNNSDKKHVKTLYYEFNSNANEARTFYISVSSSASSVYFLQVKVIESGEPLKKAGEVGYSLSMNKGRMFDDDETIEGVTFDLSSAYKALDGGYVKITSSSTISFDITNPVTLSVETGNNKTYYVTRGAAGDANETALTGVSEFQLTEGKWFISGGSNEVQLKSIAFSAAKPVYTRENLNPANIGTLCVKYNGRLEGATLYELNGKNEYNKLVFDEVENNVMVAGRPYIFVPENGNTKIEVYKSNEEFAEGAGLFHGMQGTFVALSTITDGMSSPLWGNYIISNNKYIYVDAENCSLKENRAYILSLDQVPDETPAEPNTNGSPRRRVVLGGNPAPSVVTGFDNLNEAEAPMKIMIDGQMFIIRGEKMFDATGKLVK